MKNGNWVPISKALTKHLPVDRPYSRVEAAFCLQVDFDNKSTVTVSGYSTLWRWSRKKVRTFLSKMGVAISYEDDTKIKQNQKGQIGLQIRDRKGTDKEQIKLIDNSNLQDKRDRKGTEKGQIRDRSGSTTINTKTDTDTDTGKEKNIYTKDFERFWKAYPRKVGKLAAFRKWKQNKKILPDVETLLSIISEQKKTDQWQTMRFIPHPATWLNQGRWHDEIASLCGKSKGGFSNGKPKPEGFAKKDYGPGTDFEKIPWNKG